ncbi:hypothetical protein ACFL4K_00110 [Candidatus Neomarinimicrobiota bacterium]
MTKQIQSISPNIPQPTKGMPKWAKKYLNALERTEGALVRASELSGLSYSTTYKARIAYPDFGQAVSEIKREWDSRHLAMLEDVSLAQALKPGCTTERIFRMKAFDHKYRDKQPAVQVAPISILVNFTPPKHRGTDESKEITADAEIQEIPSRTSRRRHSGANILREDDVDLAI